MCSIVLNLTEAGVFIAANRDEMVARPWAAPAEYWPGIVGGRDALAGGTWMAINRAGVMAAVLNRHGSLGPAAGKRSRGELPLLALGHNTAEQAATAMAALDAGAYRSFNLVLADARGAFWLRGLEAGRPEPAALAPGVTMLTSGEPNDVLLPRIARHLPIFSTAPFTAWGGLLADGAPPRERALNVPEQNGFGTVCASLLALPRKGAPEWRFAAGPPDRAAFERVQLPWSIPPC
ncbi:MAG: hypothetical protein B7Z80_07630 [Rhodospirillales bacterium 20-64-7]|nr:MAG: hypothetical protein B7Z80_07630 [Rhodospirillales bacterium 20-64-7]